MNKKVVTIIFVIIATGLLAFTTILDLGPTGTVYLIIDKSDYELHIYDDDGWYGTYPVVFGNKSQGDKLMEGDRKTPEGTFKIASKRSHNKWNKIMLLDYPTKESWEKFTLRKAQGIIPRSAKIGGGIGIHGTWPHDELAVDDYTDWTQGCIALRNEDIDEIYEFIRPGTKVVIRK